jgi:hypothetical protein
MRWALLVVACNSAQLAVPERDLGVDLAAGCPPGAVCCRENLECSPNFSLWCLPPGEFGGCGACLMGTSCSSDSQCPADGGAGDFFNGPVCDDPMLHGLCGGCNGGRVCTQACSSSGGCYGGRVCDPGGHCIWKPCVGNGDCAPDFTCSGGECRRRSCTRDADCPAGFCVNSACYESLGTCQPTPV